MKHFVLHFHTESIYQNENIILRFNFLEILMDKIQYDINDELSKLYIPVKTEEESILIENENVEVDQHENQDIKIFREYNLICLNLLKHAKSVALDLVIREYFAEAVEVYERQFNIFSVYPNKIWG